MLYEDDAPLAAGFNNNSGQAAVEPGEAPEPLAYRDRLETIGSLPGSVKPGPTTRSKAARGEYSGGFVLSGPLCDR